MNVFCRQMIISGTLALLSACTVFSPPLLDPGQLQPLVSNGALSPLPGLPHEESDDILKLHPELAAILDEQILPIRHPRRRADALLALLFGDDALHIQYSYSETLNARDAFVSGHGNCLSLANLVVAAARHVGLNARFQDVEVNRNWNRVGSIFFMDQHINVRIMGISSDRDYEVELRPTAIQRSRSAHLINDSTAFAHYYNNLGGEALARDEDRLAHAYFIRAVQEDPRQAFIWANLGTLYLRHQQFAAAETVLLQALALNPREYIAINNLAQLYHLTGRPVAARPYDRMAETIRLENPFYLALLAEKQLQQAHYDKARQLINTALDKENRDYTLHLLASRIHLALGDTEAALRHLHQTHLNSADQGVSEEDALFISALEAQLLPADQDRTLSSNP